MIAYVKYFRILSAMPTILAILTGLVVVNREVKAQGIEPVIQNSPSTKEKTATLPSTQLHNVTDMSYQSRQTFKGRVFAKDNNIWAYTKAFADLFGMPEQYIDAVEGIEAVAFRFEDAGFEECGFAGVESQCLRQEYCILDLYFDEGKTPLPWASDKQSEWLAEHNSIRWLKFDGRNPAFQGEKPIGMKLNKVISAAIRAFADPVSKQQAIFTTNENDNDGSADDSITGPAAVLGYSRHFFQNLTLVSTHIGCTVYRKKINMRLDAREGVADKPIAQFNRLILPEGFVSRIKVVQKIRYDKRATFYKKILPSPYGTKDVTSDQPIEIKN
ncbi:hypothetical protein ACMYR3_02310 [Ampullimonas aquatilis]|uniref:hypothetical protein n=1 Tax=Ampullimonas aquatilis TaxID=1341549 RepID=UPI003C77AA11